MSHSANQDYLVRVGIGDQDFLVSMASVESVVEMDSAASPESEASVEIVDGRSLVGLDEDSTALKRGLLISDGARRWILAVSRVVDVFPAAAVEWKPLPGRIAASDASAVVDRIGRLNSELILGLSLGDVNS